MNDLSVTWETKANSLTVGWLAFKTDVTKDQNVGASSFLSDVRSNANRMDIVALDPSGRIAGYLTDKGILHAGLLRFVADPNAVSPLERTVDRELREKIESTLRVLNPREEEIIRLRFGIGRDMPYTLEEIGRVMGLSRERVRQIEATALKKIQSAQECKDLREFLA